VGKYPIHCSYKYLSYYALDYRASEDIVASPCVTLVRVVVSTKKLCWFGELHHWAGHSYAHRPQIRDPMCVSLGYYFNKDQYGIIPDSRTFCISKDWATNTSRSLCDTLVGYWENFSLTRCLVSVRQISSLSNPKICNPKYTIVKLLSFVFVR